MFAKVQFKPDITASLIFSVITTNQTAVIILLPRLMSWQINASNVVRRGPKPHEFTTQLGVSCEVVFDKTSGNQSTHFFEMKAITTQSNNHQHCCEYVTFILWEFVKLHYLSAFLVVATVVSGFQELQWFGNSVVGLKVDTILIDKDISNRVNGFCGCSHPAGPRHPAKIAIGRHFKQHHCLTVSNHKVFRNV